MKNKLIVILFVAFSTMVYSQQIYQDVVHLKNGTIIQGIIIEQIPNKSLKIETADKSVYLYQFDEIEKLTKIAIKETDDFSNRQPGYQGVTELCYSIGTDNANGFLKLNGINGYRFSPYFSLSIGTGVWFDFDFKQSIIPLFLDFRTNFSNNKVTPYLAFGLGYSWNATRNRFEGNGYFVNVALGIGFSLTNKNAIHIGADVTRQIRN